ncbi:hypothetical protein DRW42_26185 [Pedobacter miscanthi]|uniref:Uncharacterized protein n=1 Tax=Pedobacter miscanthi TaxID=2259170 RepID=A0A366KLD2_9SPHI|nr:hypothetical protein DRW42_26185 [Pedobacter miscanthi]
MFLSFLVKHYKIVKSFRRFNIGIVTNSFECYWMLASDTETILILLATEARKNIVMGSFDYAQDDKSHFCVSGVSFYALAVAFSLSRARLSTSKRPFCTPRIAFSTPEGHFSTSEAL